MTTRETLQALQARLGLTAPALAAYLGVPVPTVRKWIAGTREPPASVVRLLKVLGLIEALVPQLHANLIERSGK